MGTRTSERAPTRQPPLGRLDPQDKGAETLQYKAFISYSHTSDDDFVDALHDAMERLAKPWNKRRARRIALDKTAMAAGSSLTETIEEKLADSQWLVLLASPESAQSKWCDEEIDYWFAHKSMDNVVVALTGGEIEVDPVSQRIEWENSSALSGRFRAAVGDDAVPLYEDLRPFKADVDHASLRNAHFRDEVAKIVGRIEDVDPGELASEDKRQFARNVRLRRAAEIGLVLLTVAAVALGVSASLSQRRAVESENQAIASEQRAIQGEQLAQENERIAKANEQQAILEARRARSSALASQAIALAPEVPDQAALLALESLRVAPTVDAFISVVNSVVSPTHFQWRSTLPGEPIVGAAAWSSDGSVAAFGTSSGEVWLVASDSSEPTLLSVDHNEVLSMAFVGDDTLLRVLDLDGRLTTWDASTQVMVGEVLLGDLLGGAISHDGSRIMTVADEFTILMFDGEGAELDGFDLLNAISSACVPTVCIAISDDGSAIAWVETDPDDILDIAWTWSGASGFSDIYETPNLIVSLSYTPTGDTLMVGDADDGAFLLPATADSVVFDIEPSVATDAEFLTYDFARPPTGAPLVVVTGHLNGSVRIWDLDEESGSMTLKALLTRHNDEVHSVTVSPDGESVLSGSWDGDIISWLSTATPNHGVVTADAHEAAVTDVTFVGNDGLIASAGFDGLVRFWSTETGGELRQLDTIDPGNGEIALLHGMDASPDGRLIAVGATLIPLLDEGSFDEEEREFVIVYDVATGDQLAVLGDLPDAAESVAFSPDGRLLAVGVLDGPVLIWKTDELDRPPVFELPAMVSTSGGLAFSGDSALLAAATPEAPEIGIWDTSTGEQLLTVRGSDVANVTAVSLNGDGSVLAWGEDTRLIGLWDLSTDQRIGESLTGHRELIADLEFADIDGDGIDGVLISTSHDATTRVWELGARRLVARIAAHDSDVIAVDVGPEGGLMVTGGRDMALWVGDLNPETWVDAACNLAGRNMSQEEWDALPGTDIYTRHCEQFGSGEGALEGAEPWTFEFTGVDTGADS